MIEVWAACMLCILYLEYKVCAYSTRVSFKFTYKVKKGQHTIFGMAFLLIPEINIFRNGEMLHMTRVNGIAALATVEMIICVLKRAIAGHRAFI